MISNFLDRYSPPGMELKQEKRIFIWGIILSILYSVFYWAAKYVEAYNSLFVYQNGKHLLNVNAEMPYFRALLGHSFIGFAILSVIMLGFIVYHYIYYRQGSMSIYLMKRLPKKSELHIRALAIPVIVVVLCVIIAFLLLMIYFAIYMLVTPKACLLPNQWQILWRLF